MSNNPLRDANHGYCVWLIGLCFTFICVFMGLLDFIVGAAQVITEVVDTLSNDDE